jgi:hypothetical protein
VAGIIGIPGRLQSVQAAAFARNPRPTSSECAGKGNPGRKPGSKNRSSLVAAALLEGKKEQLIRKAIELATGGDMQMLRFLLSRILPRERLIKLDLPQLDLADDAVEALGDITGAVSEGMISPSEGAALATLMNSYARAIDVTDLVRRCYRRSRGIRVNK